MFSGTTMMGIHQPQKELFSFSVDLDRWVRTDHPLRRLRSALDLSFVRAEVARAYGTNGHVSAEEPTGSGLYL